VPIRYYVDLGCNPREELTPDTLLDLVMRAHRVESLSGEFRRQYDVDDESLMRVRETIHDPAGETSSRETTVEALRREVDVLREFTPFCEGCPAAALDETYSCIGEIAFPISEMAEHWLLGRLSAPGTIGFSMFQQSCSELGYRDNDILDRWRAAGFLEAHRAPSVEEDGVRITSNEILHELFFVGDISPAHALGVFLHLGAIRGGDGREGDELVSMIERIANSGQAEDATTIEFAIVPEPTDDPSTSDLKLFLYTLYRAFVLQVPLAIRY
jgi:hypothetical protein